MSEGEAVGTPPDRIRAIYEKPLPAFRSGVFYNTYPYPTKIMPESIAVYIATHTNVGDTVLDAFAGSGSTGLAALMCEHPTDSMKRIARELGVEPRWGARNAVLYDISTYGCLASRVMTSPPDAGEFRKEATALVERVKHEMGSLYRAQDLDGNEGQIRHVVWSSVYRCPHCGAEFTFYDGMVRWDPVRIGQAGSCPECGHACSISDCEPMSSTTYDPLVGREVTQRRRVPVLVYGVTGKSKWRRPVNSNDLALISEIESEQYPEYAPNARIEWGELHRAGYHQGITHLHHFYTKRNFLAMSRAWHETEHYDTGMRDALRLLILSYNASHATLMTRVVAKRNSRDLVLTSSQSGVLYISNLPVEKNVFNGLERKIPSFCKAFGYVNGCSGKVTVHNASSTAVTETNESIDYVFTDPPFGGFIPYAEVNQINELWLGKTTDRGDEAIVSHSQGKGVTEYGELLSHSLAEANRVLKKDGVMTLVFHSSKADVWKALAKALHEAGLRVIATSNLDKEQDSFKQVVATAGVKNDSLMLLRKKAPETDDAQDDGRIWTPESTDPRKAYAQYVNHCMETGRTVKYDADEYRDLILGRDERGDGE